MRAMASQVTSLAIEICLWDAKEINCALIAGEALTYYGLLMQTFIQAQMKEHIKSPHHWPLCGGDSPVAGHKRKMFPLDRVNMTMNVSVLFLNCFEHDMNEYATPLKYSSMYLFQLWFRNNRFSLSIERVCVCVCVCGGGGGGG